MISNIIIISKQQIGDFSFAKKLSPNWRYSHIYAEMQNYISPKNSQVFHFAQCFFLFLQHQ